VDFQALVDWLIRNTMDVSLPSFRPELALCVTIVVLLLARVFPWSEKLSAFPLALAGAAAALYLAAPWRHLGGAGPADVHLGHEIFDGLLVYDAFTVYFRSLVLLFVVLFVVLTRISGVPAREDATDFYTLVLGAALGMCVMASANHLLMVFLGMEMASVPSYALAGILKRRRVSSEAALKYAVYGGGTAGVMLYGISLLAGSIGSVHLPTMSVRLAEMFQAGVGPQQEMVLALGGLMLMVGLAFKLSAVPFHFWCPDVFEGASAEVAAFLSVASKAAALALLVRLAVGFGHVPEPAAAVSASAIPRVEATAQPPDEITFAARMATIHNVAGSMNAALEPVRRYIGWLVTLLAAVTCTFGNLAAYGQKNIKRMLAYSTIAHAGYMMMPVAAAMALMGRNPEGAKTALAALAFYIGIYLFMNLGAFAMVAFLRNALGSEQIDDYAGLLHRCPGVVLCFSVILLSLVGLPPLAGFVAKFTIFYGLVTAHQWTLLVIGAVNTVISLFYYLRVVRVMTLAPEPAGREAIHFPLVSAPGLYVLAVTAPVLVLGVWWNGLNEWALAAASQLLS
jgi:NADH-quinone oxidoreductase subunit N